MDAATITGFPFTVHLTIPIQDFHPIIQQLTHAAQLSDADSPDEKLDKLEANFLVSDPRVLAEILQIDTGRRYEPHNLSPQQMRNRILESTAEEVCALAQQKPVLLVVEDAHWIDASTLEALGALPRSDC